MADTDSDQDVASADEKDGKLTQDKMHEKRRCTDWPCFVIFLAYLGGMVYVMAYAHAHGDFARLTNGIDWLGNVCGSGNTTKYKYLYWCGAPKVGDVDWTGFPSSLSLKRPICVESCPTDFQNKVFCAGDPEPVNHGVPTGDYVMTGAFTLSHVQQILAQHTYPTIAMGGRYCVPDPNAEAPAISAGVAGGAAEDPNGDPTSLMEDIKTGPMSSTAFQVANAAISLSTNYYLLIGIACAAIILSYAYLLTLRIFAKPLVYGCLGLLSLGIFIFSGLVLYSAYEPTQQHYNPLFLHLETGQAQAWSTVIAVVGVIIGVLVTVVICCFHEVIRTAVGCIEAACECMFGMPTLLLEPLVGAILKFGIVIGLIVGLVWLMSTGDIEKATLSAGGQEVHGVGRTVTWTDEEKYMIIFYVFGMLWIIEWCDALQNFIISYAVVLWYYVEKEVGRMKCCPKCSCCPCSSRKKPPFLAVVKGFGKGVFFHAGSLAAGAFLIAVVRFLSLIMRIVAKHAKGSGNRVMACIAAGCVCCLECFRRCMEFINKNAYIDIVINNTWFCGAARNSFKFIFANAATIGVLNGACFIFQLMGVVVPTGLTCWFTFYVVTHHPRWNDITSENYIEEPIPVTIAAGLITVAISTMFMLVFDQAADTLLYAYADNVKNSPETVHSFAPTTLANLVKGDPDAGGSDDSEDDS
jgi:hypothetical protein